MNDSTELINTVSHSLLPSQDLDYGDNPVLKAPSPALVRARIELVRMVNQVLKNAFALVGIPYLASM